MRLNIFVLLLAFYLNIKSLLFEKTELYVSNEIYSKTCSTINDSFCDGTSPSRPKKDFFSAASKLIENCLANKYTSPLLAYIIFLDAFQEAGKYKTLISLDIEKYCGETNMTLRSEKNLSYLKFSDLSSKINVPKQMSIERIRLEIDPTNETTLDSLFSLSSENSSINFLQSEVSFGVKTRSFGLLIIFTCRSTIIFTKSIFEIYSDNYLVKTANYSCQYNIANLQKIEIFDIIIKCHIENPKNVTTTQYLINVTQSNINITNVVNGFPKLFSVGNFSEGKIENVKTVSLFYSSNTDYIKLENENNFSFKNIFFFSLLSNFINSDYNTEIIRINRRNFITIENIQFNNANITISSFYSINTTLIYLNEQNNLLVNRVLILDFQEKVVFVKIGFFLKDATYNMPLYLFYLERANTLFIDDLAVENVRNEKNFVYLIKGGNNNFVQIRNHSFTNTQLLNFSLGLRDFNLLVMKNSNLRLTNTMSYFLFGSQNRIVIESLCLYNNISFFDLFQMDSNNFVNFNNIAVVFYDQASPFYFLRSSLKNLIIFDSGLIQGINLVAIANENIVHCIQCTFKEGSNFLDSNYSNVFNFIDSRFVSINLNMTNWYQGKYFSKLLFLESKFSYSMIYQTSNLISNSEFAFYYCIFYAESQFSKKVLAQTSISLTNAAKAILFSCQAIETPVFNTIFINFKSIDFLLLSGSIFIFKKSGSFDVLINLNSNNKQFLLDNCTFNFSNRLETSRMLLQLDSTDAVISFMTSNNNLSIENNSFLFCYQSILFNKNNSDVIIKNCLFSNIKSAVLIGSYNTNFKLFYCVFQYGSEYQLKSDINNTNILLESLYFYRFSGFNYSISLLHKAIIISKLNEVNLKFSIFEEGISDSGPGLSISENNFIKLENCGFLNNKAYVTGGSIIVYSYNQLIILLCRFSGTVSNDKEGGSIYFENRNFNIVIEESVFEDSKSNSYGGAISFQSFNSNITIMKTKFLAIKSNFSAVIYFRNSNSNVKIINTVFINVITLDEGVVLYFQQGNKFITLINLLLRDCISQFSLSLIYYNYENEVSLINFDISNCSFSSNDYFFKLNQYNLISILNMTLLDYFNRGLIMIQQSYNFITIENLKLLLRVNDSFMDSVINRANFIELRRSYNEIAINYTTFIKLEYFENFLYARGENKAVIKNCNFKYLFEVSRLVLMEQEYFLLAGPSSKLYLDNIYLEKNRFKAAMISISSGLLNLFSIKGNYNLIDSIIKAHTAAIIINRLFLKISSGFGDSLILFDFKFSNILIKNSEIIFSRDLKSPIYCAISSQNSNFTVIYSDFLFGLFQVSNIGALIISVSEGVDSISLISNIFINNVGAKTGVLFSHGNPRITIVNNHFILNQMTKAKFSGDSLYINLTSKRILNITKNRVYRANADFPTFISHTGYLKEYEIGMINNLNSINYKKGKANLISSDVKNVYLFKHYSGNPSIDIYNTSLSIDKIESNFVGTDCFLEIAGYDQYQNIIYLDKNEKAFDQYIDAEVMIAYKKSSDYSICIYNITNLNIHEVQRSSIQIIEKPGIFFDVNKQENFILQIILSFVDCTEGELFDKQLNLCIPCPKGFFKIISRDINGDYTPICDRCTESHPFNCYGGKYLTPKPGFSRFSLNTRKFLLCPNQFTCLGDVYYLQSLDYQKTEFLNANNQRGLCLEGHKGVLCTECEENFGKSKNSYCSPCDSKSYYIMLIGKLLFRVILIYVSISTSLSINRAFERNRYIESYVPKMSFFLRSLINHFQVLVMLNSLPFVVPKNVKQILDIIFVAGAPELGETLSFDCLLKSLEIELPTQYFKIITILAFDCMTILFFLSIEFLKLNQDLRNSLVLSVGRAVNSNKHLSFLNFLIDKGYNLIIVIMTITFIDQMKPLIELMACVDIGEEFENGRRLIVQLSIDCNSEMHIRWTLYFSIPFTFLVIIALPAYISLMLRKWKKEKILFSKEIVSKYGFLFYGYDPEKYYFELVVFFRRLLFMVLEVFFFNFPGGSDFYSRVNSTLLLLAITQFFFFIQIIIDPYNKDFFKVVRRCDILSFIVLLFTIIFAIIWLTRGESLGFIESLVILIAVIFLNISFLLFWGRHFYRYIMFEMQDAFKSVRKMLLNFKRRNKILGLNVHTANNIGNHRRSSFIAISESNKETPIKITPKNKVTETKLRSMLSSKKLIFNSKRLKSIEKENPEIEAFTDPNFFSKDDEILNLKAIIHFQQKEIESLKKLNDALLKKQATEENCVTNENKTVIELTRPFENLTSDIEKPIINVLSSDAKELDYSIVSKVYKCNKQACLFYYGMNIKSIAGEELTSLTHQKIISKSSGILPKLKMFDSKSNQPADKSNARLYFLLEESCVTLKHPITFHFTSKSDNKYILKVDVDLNDFIIGRTVKEGSSLKCSLFKIAKYSLTKENIKKMLEELFTTEINANFEDFLKQENDKTMLFSHSSSEPLFYLKLISDGNDLYSLHFLSAERKSKCDLTSVYAKSFSRIDK